jgi:hypothetical protein
MIIALDIATATGVAVGEPGSAPRVWTEDLGKRAPDEARFSKALWLTNKLIVEHKPSLIAVEAAIGGRDASPYLIGLLACVRGCAFNRGVPVKVYHRSSILKHFVGKALTARDFPGLAKAKAKFAIKEAVIARCRLLGWEVADDNAADAAALWDYANALERVQVAPAGGLFAR